MAAAGAAAGAPGFTTPGLSSVEVSPAVPEVMEPGTCSLLDADVAPHWPAKPGVYIRGAFTRQMGQQQLARMGGGARWAARHVSQPSSFAFPEQFAAQQSIATACPCSMRSYMFLSQECWQASYA